MITKAGFKTVPMYNYCTRNAVLYNALGCFKLDCIRVNIIYIVIFTSI